MKSAPVALALLALAAAAPASEPDPSASSTAAVLARIEKRMAEVTTVRASFHQVKRIPLFARQIELEGEIGLEKPDRFAWRVRKPVPYCLVMDHSGFMQWDAETGRVQRGRLDNNPVLRVVVEQLTGFFSGRFLKMTDQFDISVTHASPVELTGRPRPGSPAASSLRSFTVRFGLDERTISSITVVESEGGETRLQFYDVRPNEPLPPEFWKVPPLEP